VFQSDKSPRLDAIAWLDPPLLLERKAAGRSYAVCIGGNPTRLTLPKEGVSEIVMSTGRRGDPAIPTFPRPRLAPQLTPKVHAHASTNWAMPEHVLAASAIRLRWRDPALERVIGEIGAAGEFSRVLARWISIVRDWLAAWTGNVRELVEIDPIPVVHVARSNDPDTLPAKAGGATPVFVMDQKASSTSELAAAFRAASADAELPLERRLLFEAVVLAHRTRYREAVITACSAAEVALSTSATVALSLAGRGEVETTEILAGVRGVVELYRLNASRREGVPISIGQVKHQLARPRNLAAHAGATLDKDTARDAIKTARALLELAPLPTPQALVRATRKPSDRPRS